MAQTYFATTLPGFEDVLQAEVRAIGGKKATTLRGGVEFRATTKVAYRALIRLRTANRLWLRVDEFRAKDAAELYNKTKRIEWTRLIPEGARVFATGHSSKSRLIHSGKVEAAVEAAVTQAASAQIGRGEGAFEVMARIENDRCQLSLDASGELLFRRGWKEMAVKAPIRETTAAAVLAKIGWTPETPLVDPFCGSGTFVIEAAQAAANVPAGASRQFAVQSWANFDAELWAQEIEEARSESAAPAVHFRGFDRDERAIESSRHNAALAGVEAWCSFEARDVAELQLDGPAGWIVTNPPWGGRLAAAPSAVAGLLERAAQTFADWRIAVVLPTRQSIPDGLEELVRFDSGGIDVRLLVSAPS